MMYRKLIKFNENSFILAPIKQFMSTKNNTEKPGDGLRSMRSTTAFRVLNFELYAKPNIVIMGIGLTCFGIALGYIAYMRQKYESMGYYSAVSKDGKEIFEKKKSKWD